jgi:uncharacterized protein (TIGR03663 family)
MDINNSDDSILPKSEKHFDLFWLVSCGLVAVVAAFLRFYWLSLKPLHHDEGVNGYFLTTLFRDGVYKYDPANYHGPTLYYIALAFTKVFGLNTFSVRASVAVFGVLTVLLVFWLRDHIGRTGSLFAALFVALSPGLSFISRYFIHETFFVFLSLALVVAILGLLKNEKAGPFALAWMALIILLCLSPATVNLSALIAGDSQSLLWAFRIAFLAVGIALTVVVIRLLVSWNGGRPVYLILAAACVALLFATKETAFITLGTMAAACVCVPLWRRLRVGVAGETVPCGTAEDGLAWSNFRRSVGAGSDRVLVVTSAAVVFIYLFVLFFSSFFTFPEGVSRAFEAYSLWTKTGGQEHTQNGTWAYLRWGFQVESPILVLSAAGAVLALVKARHRFAMFASFWAFGLLAAYTIIPYKTPWLAVSFLLPMCLAAGYLIDQLGNAKNILLKILAGILAVTASVVLAYQSYVLNFVRYDDDQMPYVYAHTKREFLEMIDAMNRFADKSGKGNEAVIQVISPDYWPMVWYVNDYKHANFWGHPVDADNAEMIVAKKGEQDAEVMRRYAVNYQYVGSWELRPGVELVLLVRRDLAGGQGEELYKIGGVH